MGTMPDNASVTPANTSAVIDEISLCVYQAILEIQQQQPELLREKYKNVPWRNVRNQSAFLEKLKEGLSKTRNQEALIMQVQKYCKFCYFPVISSCHFSGTWSKEFASRLSNWQSLVIQLALGIRSRQLHRYYRHRKR
jgi:hypothetical protein